MDLNTFQDIISRIIPLKTYNFTSVFKKSTSIFSRHLKSTWLKTKWSAPSNLYLLPLISILDKTWNHPYCSRISWPLLFPMTETCLPCIPLIPKACDPNSGLLDTPLYKLFTSQVASLIFSLSSFLISIISNSSSLNSIFNSFCCLHSLIQVPQHWLSSTLMIQHLE